jgi:ribosomal protein S27E
MKIEHSENCHTHVRCPGCKGDSFEILIYHSAPFIKCSTCGEGIDLTPDLIEAYKANLHTNN